MMIKKYLLTNSPFYESLILSLIEPGRFGFVVEELSNEEKRLLFPINKIKVKNNEVDIKSIPAHIEAVYLDETYLLKAIVISCNNKFYLFKTDQQKLNQLNIHNKYISSDLSLLLDDYEKHCKNKGKSYYDGVGDFKQIKDLNYFENIYQKEYEQHLDKKSNVFKLTFSSNNMFVVDFVNLVENHKITIVNQNLIDKKAFTLSSMEKNRNDRQDCLLIDSDSKDIKYLIFTYKPFFLKHYLLLKNLGNNKFEFVKETTCFNEILLSEGIKDLQYKNASNFAIKSFAKMHYENFCNEYISFELEEEIDEQVKEIVDQQIVEVKAEARSSLILEALSIVKEKRLPLDIKISLHGKERLLERIGKMNEEEMLSLVKVAFEDGKTSGHYIEKDQMMFKFLRYQQGKKLGKMLKIYNGVLFFFSLNPPHELVTCFPYQNNYDLFVSNKKNSKK